jgi:hypothetical protein
MLRYLILQVESKWKNELAYSKTTSTHSPCLNVRDEGRLLPAVALERTPCTIEQRHREAYQTNVARRLVQIGVVVNMRFRHDTNFKRTVSEILKAPVQEATAPDDERGNFESSRMYKKKSEVMGRQTGDLLTDCWDTRILGPLRCITMFLSELMASTP